MRVRDLMTVGVISLTPSDTVAAARQRFRERDIHHLLIMEGAKVVGVVTHRQISGRPDEERLRNVMSREIVSIDPDATIRKAASLMIGGTTGCLPVIDGTKLAGILTTSDLRRAVANAEETLR